jgi:hypothetical protein
MSDDDDPNPELIRAGEAVARLSRPEPPAGLAARTLARISAQYKPIKKVFWMLRPITHPVARVAAAAMIIYALAPMTDFDVASNLGSQIEQHVTGRAFEDHVEALVDTVTSPNGESQTYLDSFMGVPRVNGKTARRVTPPAHTRMGT